MMITLFFVGRFEHEIIWSLEISCASCWLSVNHEFDLVWSQELAWGSGNPCTAYLGDSK